MSAEIGTKLWKYINISSLKFPKLQRKKELRQFSNDENMVLNMKGAADISGIKVLKILGTYQIKKRGLSNFSAVTWGSELLFNCLREVRQFYLPA